MDPGLAVDKSDPARAAQVLHDLSEAVLSAVVVKEETLRLAIVAMLARGHVLIEDVPGVGKTLLARTLAQSIGGTFRRLQFTPDLLPADITGSNIFDLKSREFHFRPGPVFANLVLADEINRGTPRAQSALLEAMGEDHVSVDGETHQLPDPFLIMATQNPIEQYGTFPLPESELDRFMIMLHLGSPDEDQTREILRRHEHAEPARDALPILDPSTVRAMQDDVFRVHASEAARTYVGDIVLATREHPSIGLAASPRASVALLRASQAMAVYQGRSHILPDDIKAVAPAVLSHRLAVSTGDAEGVVEEILQRVPVPISV